MNRAAGGREGRGKLLPWHRFHLKLSMLYGGVVTVLLAALAILVVHLAVEAAEDGARGRAMAVALSLSLALEPPTDPAGRAPAPNIAAAAEGVVSDQVDVRGIYGLASTSDPERFTVVFARGPQAPQSLDKPFDVAHDDAIQRGLDRPVSRVISAAHGQPALVHAYAPWRHRNGRPFGLVAVAVDGASIDQMWARMMMLVLGGVAVMALLIWMVNRRVSSRVAAPFQRILDATSAIAKGDYSVRLSFRGHDEFSAVGSHFNRMASGLAEREFIRETLGRYMSPEVARVMLADPSAVKLGGELREVTIFFSDISGYSTVSERLTPSEVVELINNYFTAMHTIIEGHHGSVIEYLGDGMLVTFGAPIRRDDHAELAVRCALAMDQRLVKLNEAMMSSGLGDRLAEIGVGRLQARIGIHTGTVVAGNLGSPKRMKYGVIGDAVNLASRLEVLNKELGTHILMSDSVHQRLPTDLRTQVEIQGVHQVKGRSGLVGVFSI